MRKTTCPQPNTNSHDTDDEAMADAAVADIDVATDAIVEIAETVVVAINSYYLFQAVFTSNPVA
jgi:hypothetical protein